MGKRSNGCVTCRKRKVKCDETKPTCIRCSKATYTCKGYDQPWLDEAPFIALAHQRAAEREKEKRESRNGLLPSEALQSEGFLSAERITGALDLSGFQEVICRSFVFHKLSAGPQYSKAMSWWLSATPKAEVQSRTLVSASKAMSAVFFGRVHRQASITREGESMYGQAMHNLRQDLLHPIKAYAFETLGATMALNMYELVHMYFGPVGIITHAGGIGRLMEVRGPELHKTYPEKTLFRESRLLLVSNGLFACQRTFLEEPKWKNLPWEDDLPAKTSFDYIIDVLSDVPSFLEQAISSFSPAGTSTTNLTRQPNQKRLQEQVFERLRTVKGLREKWYENYSNPVWHVPPKTPPAVTLPSGSHPFETVLYFTDFWRAWDFCAFHTTLLLLVILYEQTVQDLDPFLPHPNQALQALFPEMSVRSLVRDICRCSEYLLLDIHGSRGYIIFVLPAIVGYFASDMESLEARWLYSVCKDPAASSGFGFGATALDSVTPLSSFLADCKRRRRDAYPDPQYNCL